MGSETCRALVSSDWNECLAPCGPFDMVAFHYPDHLPVLESIFRQYTGNVISLGAAIEQILTLLPGAIARDQMDAYLDAAFETYRGVPELMEWCRSRNILFMINTTGAIGYFQRAWAKGLLPQPAVLSAHPWVSFPVTGKSPEILELRQTTDKGRHTAAVADRYGIPADKIVIIGDSGGDGPHFDWGASAGAWLIGSMTKVSLQRYCLDKGISPHREFGHTYNAGESKSPEKERAYDFLDLKEFIEAEVL